MLFLVSTQTLTEWGVLKPQQLNKNNDMRYLTHHQVGTKNQAFLFATHLLLEFLQLLLILSNHVLLGFFHIFDLATQHANLNKGIKSK